MLKLPNSESESRTVPRTSGERFSVTAKLYAPKLTATDFALVSESTASKVEIGISLAQQELEGWHLFAGIEE
jgi:hypothetical protein